MSDGPEDRNPQIEQMADEAMVRTLRGQAAAIWPQESTFFDDYDIGPAPQIIDIGCGTGEITYRIAERYPEATILGIDVIAEHLATARQRSAAFGSRVSFREGDAYHVTSDDGAYDLAILRHVSQIVPNPGLVYEEMIRLTKPGGYLHILAEDYGMIHFDQPDENALDLFWRQGPIPLGTSMGINMTVGRSTWRILRSLGQEDITLRYVTVDVTRVPRATILEIWTAWRDGYTKVIADHSTLKEDEVAENWDRMISALEDESRYFVWQIPVYSVRLT